jgi:hypothetical protein
MTIEVELFDGTVLEFPDGTDPAVIQRKGKEITLQRRNAAAPAAQPYVVGRDGPLPPPRADAGPGPMPPMQFAPPVTPSAAPEPSLIDTIMGAAPGVARGLQIGAQGAGRGVADFLGMPGDVATGMVNMGLGSADTLTELIMGDAAPDALDFRFGPSPVGSDSIADAASNAAEFAGIDVIGRDEMSPVEKFANTATRFGTLGLGAGLALMRAAPASPSETLSGATSSNSNPCIWTAL